MALRWARTIDEAPHMFASRDEDWLSCGAWQIGPRPQTWRCATARLVLIAHGSAYAPGSPVDKHGDAVTIEEAKERLIIALRAWAAWAAWAGVRRCMA